MSSHRVLAAGPPVPTVSERSSPASRLGISPQRSASPVPPPGLLHPTTGHSAVSTYPDRSDPWRAPPVARHGKLPPQRHEELPPPWIAEERANERGANHGKPV